jgi:hypothetical protein
MSNSVKVKINPNLEHIEVDKLEPLQGELKTLSEANFNKLRKSMLDKGFKLSLHVWKNGGVNYLIDGHQRVHVLQQMKKQGIEIPPIPCVIVQARTYSEAKETVLLAVSQYGKLNKAGFQEFIDGEDFDLDDFDFPDITDDFFETAEEEADKEAKEEIEDDVPDIEENENPYGVERGQVWGLGKELKCDSCGHVMPYDESLEDQKCPKCGA